LRLSGEFGGKSVANAMALTGARRTDSGTIDPGKAIAADSDPTLVVDTDASGRPSRPGAPPHGRGQETPEAETVAGHLGGTIVGEAKYIHLYQIRSSGTAQVT